MSSMSCVRSSHPDVEFAFQVALLRRRQLVVKNDQIRRIGGDSAMQFFKFAAANEGSRIRSWATLQKFTNNRRPGAGGQFAQLGHRLFH